MSKSAYTEKCFIRLFDIVSEQYPDIYVILVLNEDAGRKDGKSSSRQFAFTEDDGSNPIKIAVASKIFYQSNARVEGILMHEFGHAILLSQDIEHTEKDADKIAEEVFGCYIYYDEDLVQNTDHGTRPRPRNL